MLSLIVDIFIIILSLHIYGCAVKKTNLDLTRGKKEFGGSVGRPAKGSGRSIERWWRWRQCKLRDDAPYCPSQVA